MLLAAELERIKKMSPAEREALLKQSSEVLKHTRWIPAPGPQTQAYDCKADILLYGGEAGGGKLMKLNQRLTTPYGFVEMGDIKVGDALIDRDGNPCSVTRVFDIEQAPELWRLYFDDCSYVDCCIDHNWVTYDNAELQSLLKRTDEWRDKRKAERASRKTGKKSDKFTAAIIARNKANPPKRLPLPQGTVRTTREIVNTLRRKCNGGANHAIANCLPVEFSEKKLPLDPYTLGAWLGDGTAASSSFTGIDPEIWEQIERASFTVTHSTKQDKRHCIRGLSKYLRLCDVLNNKHIPQIYLRSSKSQRLALLQGLMDTDGTVCKESGASEFCNTNERIIDGVYEIICSLGWKVNKREGRAKLYGRDCGPKWTLKFTPTEYVFLLSRKRNIQKLATRRTTRFRYIVDAQRIQSEPGRCISVDSPSRTYLAGNSFLPTHNSDLLLGLALSQHKRSLIMRREYTDLGALTERAIAIHGSKKGFNGSSPPKLNTSDGRRIDFGAAKNLGDEAAWMGREHSLLGFDEAAQFAESQIRFLFTWVRTSVPGERTRIILATNPPITAEGEWLIAFFSPWLDPGHRNPAKPGELRWFIAPDAGKDIEVPDGKPFFHEGKEYIPMSRTFIPAKVSDNPYYSGSEYRAKLDSLPEPYRSAYRDGNFMIGRKDAERQCIPSAWVRDAQARWTPRPPEGVPMCTIAGDPAMGGQDDTVLGTRYDSWFSEMIATPGVNTPTGSELAGLIVQQRRHGAEVVLDFGGGYGGAPALRLKDNDIIVTAHKGAEKSSARTADGKFKFVNKRSEVIWKLREALDPTQDGGSPIQLPPDAQLFGDLTAPTFEITANGIKVETKDDVKKKLGRSPGKGDVAAMLWSTGQKLSTNYDSWKKATAANTPPKVVLGRPQVIRRRPF